jgi:hypothetical protein
MNMTTRYSVCERIPQRIFTRDAMVRTRHNRDTLLKPEVTPKNPDMNGRISPGAEEERPEKEFDLSTSATPQSLNDAARNFWSRTQSTRPVTQDRVAAARDFRRTPQLRPSDINRWNREFYGNGPEQPFNRPWGKG